MSEHSRCYRSFNYIWDSSDSTLDGTVRPVTHAAVVKFQAVTWTSTQKSYFHDIGNPEKQRSIPFHPRSMYAYLRWRPDRSIIPIWSLLAAIFTRLYRPLYNFINGVIVFFCYSVAIKATAEFAILAPVFPPVMCLCTFSWKYAFSFGHEQLLCWGAGAFHEVLRLE